MVLTIIINYLKNQYSVPRVLEIFEPYSFIHTAYIPVSNAVFTFCLIYAFKPYTAIIMYM
jgi:hypothetical protein